MLLCCKLTSCSSSAGCAMGFCFYNNVVLAALSLLEQGLERVLIFDWVRPAAVDAPQCGARCPVKPWRCAGAKWWQPPEPELLRRLLQDVHHGNGAQQSACGQAIRPT
jgi:Histone deacetylase domain